MNGVFFRTFNLEPKIERFLYDPMLRYAYSFHKGEDNAQTADCLSD